MRNKVLANLGVSACFVAAGMLAVGFVVFFWWDGDTLWMGACLGASFVGLAVGLVLWSHHLMPQGPFHEEYPELESPPEEQAEVLARLDRGDVGRRRLLIGSLGLAGGAVTAAFASSVRSLGPGPFSLYHTPWRGGREAVTEDGSPVQTRDMQLGGVLTIFPKGFVDAPEAQAVLIRLPPGLNQPLPGRRHWAPDGYICYSRVCSHAGCPVTMYNAVKHELQCPCHQSTFNVLKGAEPVFGPAGGPLVQLPLAINPDGTLRSTGDFSGPPGPVFWHRT